MTATRINYFGMLVPPIVPVTQPPMIRGRYLVLIEGITLAEPNWWRWDGRRWDHDFIVQHGEPGMPGRRLFWVVRSQQPLELPL